MTRLLVIGAVWPEPRSSAAGAHILDVLRPLIREGWDITYASTAAKSPYAIDLSSLGVSTQSASVNDSSFDDALRTLRPEVVLFDRFFIEEQFGWRVEQQCPDALRILNCEDLHFLRHAREQAYRQGRPLADSDLRNDIARREVAAILRSDLTLVISTHEINLLREFFQVDPRLLHYSPFMVEPLTKPQIKALPRFHDRRDFFTVGNFRHAPNWDGIQWLKSEIWPLIRKRLPEVRLHVAGAYASDEQMALHAPDQGFFMEGRIEDANARFRQSRVCLAPLRFGAGLKGKFVDAMKNGTPSITTEIGAESMASEMGWAGFIGSDTTSIAEAAVRLYENEAEWSAAQSRGFRLLESMFNRKFHEPLLLERIENARSTIQEDREKNFLGSVLRHHHHRSTRYLSLWIEAKRQLAKASD